MQEEGGPPGQAGALSAVPAFSLEMSGAGLHADTRRPPGLGSPAADLQQLGREGLCEGHPLAWLPARSPQAAAPRPRHALGFHQQPQREAALGGAPLPQVVLLGLSRSSPSVLLGPSPRPEASRQRQGK